MVRSDLHVHSRASKRPSEWFLKKVGASESYTRIETLYAAAKKRGMDFVTVTDHNTIEGGLELVEKYPDDTFLSVEVTTYFPENNCKLHVLVYDITPEHFSRINSIRRNVYLLRDYIKKQNLAYSVAHGFYNINHKLDIEIIEKTILLFDVFEGLNGARNKYFNETWQQILASLTPGRIQSLKKKHKIDPMSDTPWMKGITGGSDDHAGLFIGLTSTASDCPVSRTAFIQSIKNKQTRAEGRCNDYKSFAFSIYKIFCDYSTTVRNNVPNGILAFVNSVIFEKRQSRLKKWVTLRKIKKGKQIKDKIILRFFEDVYNWSHNEHLEIQVKMDNIYTSLGFLLDEFFKMVLLSFEKDFAKGDIGKLFANMMASCPALFISFPFFSSLRHLSQDRDLILSLKQRYLPKEKSSDKKVLWFSDTITDLNGVSVTLGRFRQQAVKKNMNLIFVTCSKDKAPGLVKEENRLNLPCMHTISPEFYSSYTLSFPSLLASMEMIHQCRPDRIIVSTPGPVGILGMLMAGLLGIDCVTIYHTDFAAQAEYLFKDEALAGFIQSAVNRFYSFSTHIKVPTKEYIQILSRQNYDTNKMSLFKRGYTPRPLNTAKNNMEKGFTLMWAGRISKDKNIEFLIDVYKTAAARIPDLNLVLCGDGPDLEALKAGCTSEDRIHFSGYLCSEQLETYYASSDLFIFPSTTDTFGMVILEAQANGLHTLVTDVGGPQEIIEDGLTGSVLNLSDMGAWVVRIEALYKMKAERPDDFAMMKAQCRKRILDTYNWNDALLDIMGTQGSIPVQQHKNRVPGKTGLMPSQNPEEILDQAKNVA